MEKQKIYQRIIKLMIQRNGGTLKRRGTGYIKWCGLRRKTKKDNNDNNNEGEPIPHTGVYQVNGNVDLRSDITIHNVEDNVNVDVDDTSNEMKIKYRASLQAFSPAMLADVSDVNGFMINFMYSPVH
jgi:hypothetical protein